MPTPISLRPYQQECVDTIDALEGGAHLVQMATGLGKTVTFSAIKRRGRVLILSHRDELVRQPVRYYDCPVGIEKASETSNGEEVVSASVQTLSRAGRLERFAPGAFDTIITDEAHHALAASYRKIVDHLQPRLHLGFTATPRRGDDRGLSPVFDDIVFSRDLLWGIEHGYLVDVDCHRVEVNWDTRGIKRSKGDYAMGELDRAVNTQITNSQVAAGYLVDVDCHRVEVNWDTRGIKRSKGDYAMGELDRAVNTQITNSQVAAAYRELAVGQTLVFATSVAHAYALAELIGAQVIEGATPGEERRRILQEFLDRKVKAIVNCGVLTEGTDLPLVETVLIARPTQSSALYSQMVGRGLRLSPGKTALRLIDCVGVSDDRQLCTAPSLVGMNEKDFPEGATAVDGLLTGLRDRLEEEEDCLTGWILRTRKVDVLWGSGIAWVRGFDGWRHVTGNSWALTLAGPDDVDQYHARWWVRGEDGTDERGGESFKTLRAAERWCGMWLSKTKGPADQAALWDAEKVSNWAGQPATEKQMDYLRKLVSAEELGDRKLSRHEASVCIDRAKERSQRKGLPGALAGGRPQPQPRPQPAAERPARSQGFSAGSATRPRAGKIAQFGGAPTAAAKPAATSGTKPAAKPAVKPGAKPGAKSAPLGTCPLCGEALVEASGGRKVRCPSNRWRKGDDGWHLAEGDGFEFWRELGTCPLCGEALVEASGGRKVRCPSNRWRKGDDGWHLAEGDGFEFWRELGGKPLSPKEVRELATLETVALASGTKVRLEQVPGGLEKGWRVKVVRSGVFGSGRGR